MELGVYRSKDPVENLRFTINIRKVTASSTNHDHEERISAATYEASSREFRWQEKVFSRQEIELYKDENNCTTKLEKEYHQVVSKMGPKSSQPAEPLRRERLFTYVNNDDYFAAEQADAPVFTGNATQRSTFLVDRVNEVRRRHGVRHAEMMRTRHNPHIDDLVTTAPTNRDKARHVVDTPFQIMYIMADLSEEEDKHDATLDDHLLCSIKIDENGTLEASPAFNQGRPPYRIHTRLGTIFEYSLVHTSKRITRAERHLEAEMLNELTLKHAMLLEKRVGKVFDEVPADEDVISYHILGEIVQTDSFEYDNLYVNLLFELPNGWQWAHSEPPQFVTQVSRASHIGDDDGVCKFAYPFELDLKCHIDAEEKSLITAVPKLLFQVNSIDYFNRYRPEGYGHFPIPTSTGKHEVKVQSWRPRGAQITGQMQRFFIGGAPELEDVSYVAIPPEHHVNDPVLSKLGFQTETSGNVSVRFHVMKQRAVHKANNVAKRHASPQKSVKLAQVAELSKTTLSVLSAFKRAHSRLQASKFRDPVTESTV